MAQQKKNKGENMEQTFIWKDPHSIRTETVRYTINGDNCHVINIHMNMLIMML